MSLDGQWNNLAGSRAVGLLEGRIRPEAASKISHAVAPAGGRGRRIEDAHGAITAAP